MTRRIRTFEETPRVRFGDLAKKLAEELKSNRESGQPIIDEQHHQTGTIGVNVIWDVWDHVPLEGESTTILRAYELAEGKDSRDRIALAMGYTVPEATTSGMLPYRIVTALRKSDPVTLEQCREAMIAEGGSRLFDPNDPQLRFPTEKEAADCLKRLAARLPGSEPVWVVVKDLARADEWALQEEP